MMSTSQQSLWLGPFGFLGFLRLYKRALTTSAHTHCPCILGLAPWWPQHMHSFAFTFLAFIFVRPSLCFLEKHTLLRSRADPVRDFYLHERVSCCCFGDWLCVEWLDFLKCLGPQKDWSVFEVQAQFYQSVREQQGSPAINGSSCLGEGMECREKASHAF